MPGKHRLPLRETLVHCAGQRWWALPTLRSLNPSTHLPAYPSTPMPLNPFLGVWQRRSIQFDQGPIETSQSVLWIQAETYFADVRSAPFAGRLTPERYRAMDWRSRFDADLLGFAGTFSWSEAPPTCTWHHRLALTPRQWPDTSNYQWLGADEFLEQGTCEDDEGGLHPFVEHWHRLHPGPVQVWRLDQAEQQGQALRVGNWAVLVHQWRSRSVSSGESPQADPLQEIDIFRAFSATAWEYRDATWRALFGTETSLGTPPRWTPLDLDDPLGLWQLERSTPVSQSLELN
ncbi:hypothetical protein H6F75_19360 [Nodosilinea sp. FACHB-131]|uniref:hypothetical protein n=1 Tax=Cyanophyceae TaxID=3028117 RepID=UPI001689DEE6|nr:hypothetical protein [Nodosilinea sp. FACHB-131]MBD1875644.1 hypothetical protein [Nodosilinea sp. FACHB-131]